VLENFFSLPAANCSKSALFTEKMPLLQAIQSWPRSSAAMP
jgi:hypothetical protein